MNPTTIFEPPRRRHRWVWWLIAVLVVGALAAAAAVVVTRHRAAGEPAPRETVAVETAKLERRDLSTTTSLTGNLGFGAPRPLAGHTEATVTWLPRVGVTIKRGKQLFRADDKPVTLFYGGMPLFRAITGENMVGRDVRIVADNLRALGYRIGRQPYEGRIVAGKKIREGDGVLTTSLINAVKRWQDDVGLPVTGTIAVGDVEVQSGAVRVDSLTVQPGSAANAPLMTVTSTRKVITVSAEMAEAGAMRRGARVTVALPDDRTVKARVVSVGRDLTPVEGVSTGAPKLTVAVTVDDPGTVAKLDTAEVKVNFPGRTAKGVLAAPIEALVALTEGGYAIQGPSGLVAVKTGMFADGWVQITGAGLAEGTDVVVSS